YILALSLHDALPIYIGFVLIAMGNEYFPRVAASLNDPFKLRVMISHQIEIALLIGIPALLVTYLYAPIVLRLLFSADFASATEVLRLFVLGDLVKLTAFPMRYVVMSSGRGGYFLFSELIPVGVLLALVFFAGDILGMAVIGYGYIIMNLLVFALSLAYCRRKYSYQWGPAASRIVMIGIAAMFVAVISSQFQGAAYVHRVRVAAAGGRDSDNISTICV